MAKRALSMIAAGCMLVAQSVWAYAADPIWQWDHPSATGYYTGSQSLTDGVSSLTFSRSPNLAGSGSTVSQPPVLLMSGLDIDFEIVQAGSTQNMTVNGEICPSGTTFSVYATPVTVCDSGVANNLQGIHVKATKLTNTSGTTPGTFKPQLMVYTNGSWKEVTGNACGMLEMKRFCKD